LSTPCVVDEDSILFPFPSNSYPIYLRSIWFLIRFIWFRYKYGYVVDFVGTRLVENTEKKNNDKKHRKKKEIQLNQVRLHLLTSSRTHLYVYLRYLWLSISLEMRFAHLLKPCNVRFMFRFAQHGSHHMSFVHMDFLLICSLHISYVREFLGGLRSPMLIGFQRGSMC